MSYAGVIVDAAARATSVAALIGSLGGVGLAMLAYVLWRGDDELLPWALLMAGLGYGVSLGVHSGAIDERAPLVGAGLLLCGELATWSVDERWSIRAERVVVVARAGGVAGLVLGGLLAGGLVVTLAATPAGGGLAWTIIGASAIVAVLLLAVRLSRP